MGRMRVDFIGHATLLVRMGGLGLLSDPWWAGPAYRGQWYPYPLPVPERYDLRDLDAVYISHAHEDHLHPGTLKALLEQAPGVQAIIPRRYDTQMRDYLRRLGFGRIREVPSGTPFVLRKGDQAARLTLLTHMDDSLLAIESDGETLINANDALHASRRALIAEYCRILRGRFPTIDYLFCGFGGASYFPNCIHVPGKDDLAVARAREQFFLDNFALVTRLLQPKVAVPFAAHFVLPAAHTWWISASRLRMEAPAETVRRKLGPSSSTQVYDLAPGDFIERGQVHRASPGNGHASDDVEAARQTVLARYPAAATPTPLSDEAFAALVDEVRQTITRQAAPADDLDAVLLLWDAPGRAMHIRASHGQVQVEAVATNQIEQIDPQVVVETRSDLITRTMRSPFGRDFITIGYGAQVRLRSRDEMARAPHERLLNLLAPPSPRWRQRLRRAPLRTLGFAVGDPSMRYALLGALRQRARRRAGGRTTDEPTLYGIGDWAQLAQTPE
jgi:hypothetical protein